MLAKNPVSRRDMKNEEFLFPSSIQKPASSIMWSLATITNYSKIHLKIKDLLL